jgi:hypothetical protein
MSLGTGVVASGGVSDKYPQGGDTAWGGAGGAGRIRAEYCETYAGTTNPPASSAKLTCYIAEQIESALFNRARLTLPESFAGGRTYRVQYGRKLDFTTAGEQTSALRLPGGALTSVTLDALLSNLTPGSLTFKLDVGNNGSWDWQETRTVTTTLVLNSPDLAAAFSEVTAGQTSNVDVPIKVSLSQGGQVILTNLEIAPASGVDVHPTQIPSACPPPAKAR